jgi:glycosyltransferase involved in cell wall biosynthesis
MIAAPKKKVAVFLPALFGGGAERTMLNLSQGIAQRGYSVDLVLAQAEGPYLSEVPSSVRMVDLGAGRQCKSNRTVRRLPALVRYLRRERPDALLAALVRANVIALCARRLAGIPSRVVINEQNTLSFSAAQSGSRLRRWSPKLARMFYPWADRVIGVSQGVADDLVNTVGIPSDLVEVIYNPGVTPELEFKASAESHHPWLRPGQPPVILAVGSLSVQKDFPTLIRAFAAVRKSRPARLLILGEGRERSALEALIRELGLQDDVSLPGFVDNPYAYMSRAAVFVLSSRWEGLPTVLVEALYCGVPLVATDCPSGPREILQGGRLGGLIQVGNIPEMSLAIERALDGQGPRADRDSWRPYGLDAVVEKYIDALFPR